MPTKFSIDELNEITQEIYEQKLKEAKEMFSYKNYYYTFKWDGITKPEKPNPTGGTLFDFEESKK